MLYLDKPKFSVLMSVYINDNSDFFEMALKSILIQQTLKPDQIVIVQDGPVEAGINTIIEKYTSKYAGIITIIRLAQNLGLGDALREGLKFCKHDIVARMDSDDISSESRFESQIAFLLANRSIDVVGSAVEEFNRVPGDLNQFRVLPEGGTKLLQFSKLRSPLNHPTIMFKKAIVMDAGSYDGEIRLFEDFSLFIRLLTIGAKFHNLQESLLYFRIGNGIESIRRRRGISYLKSEVRFIKMAFKIGHLSFTDVALYVILKFPLRILPPKLLIYFYKKILRSKT